MGAKNIKNDKELSAAPRCFFVRFHGDRSLSCEHRFIALCTEIGALRIRKLTVKGKSRVINSL